MIHNVFVAALGCLLAGGAACAQGRPDPAVVPAPAHLRPIERAPGSSALGSVYFYGTKRLKSPYSLEIPLHELADPDAERYFRRFKRYTSVSQVVAVAPLLYLLVQPRNQWGRSQEYWAVMTGSVVASLALTIGGNVSVSRAVRRYNQVLHEKRLGLSVAPVSGTGQTAVGLGIGGRF